MTTTSNLGLPSSSQANRAEPAWEIARLFPLQGEWSDGDFLDLVKTRKRMIELVDRRIEFLPMPTVIHQFVLQYFYNLLTGLNAGFAVTLGLRIRLKSGTFREPDVLFLLNEHAEYLVNDFWEKADLVLEVVSPDMPSRDYVEKRRDYAEAGIAEYWIFDPQKRAVRVLELVDGVYTEHGPYTDGDTATSILLPQFNVSIARWFAAARFDLAT